MKVKINKWGYGGIETAINGLVKWIQQNQGYETTNYKDALDCFNKCARIIVRYGKENIPHFVSKGSLGGKANYVAKKIAQNNKFQHFCEWVNNNYQTKEE